MKERVWIQVSGDVESTERNWGGITRIDSIKEKIQFQKQN